VFTNMSYTLRIGVFLSVIALSGGLYKFVNSIGGLDLEAKKVVKKEERKVEKTPKVPKKKKRPSEIHIKIIRPIHIATASPNGILDISNCNRILPVVYDKVINFKNLPVPEKKRKFFSFMLPQILIVNFEINEQRKAVEKIKKKLSKGSRLTKAEEHFLRYMLKYYKAKSIDDLIKRLHVNPPSLVMAQAIAESGWGTSRFYLKGANAFGITAIRGKGRTIKMNGYNIYMRKYPDVISSIRDYYYSINVSWAFQKLRKVRLSTNDPMEICDHLDYYSTLRDIYIRRIQHLIKINNLTKFDGCKLDPIYIQEIPLSQYLKEKHIF